MIHTMRRGSLFYVSTILILSFAIGAPSAQAEPATSIPTQVYGLGPINAVAYSPDGSMIAAAADKTIQVFDRYTGERLLFLNEPTPIYSVEFSADGSMLLGGCSTSAKLWDVATGNVIRTFYHFGLSMQCSAISPDGRKIATGAGYTFGGNGPTTAQVWDVETGMIIQTLAGHTDEVRSIAFSPDGTKLVTASLDGSAKLWDAASGDLIRSIECDGAVFAVAFSPDGTKVLTGSFGNDAQLWDAETGNLLTTFSDQRANVLSVAFSPDGTRVLTGADWDWEDSSARLWNASTGELLQTFVGHQDRIMGVAFSPGGGKVLTGSFDGTVRLWNAFDGTLIRKLGGHESAVTSVAFSPDGSRVLTGGGQDYADYMSPNYDTTAILWSKTTGDQLASFDVGPSYVTSVAFSPDGTKILTGTSNCTALLWNPLTEVVEGTFNCAEASSRAKVAAVFSPDGSKILTAADHVKLWDAATSTEIRTFADGSVAAIFSPDGSKILTGGCLNDTAKLWDASNGELLQTFTGHTELVCCLAFSPDGSRILTGASNEGHWQNDSTARLWDVVTGNLLHEFSVEDSTVYNDSLRSVDFSPEGDKVLIGYRDTRAILWDIESETMIRSYHDNQPLYDVAFSPDGTQLLTGGYSYTAKLWDVYPLPPKNAVEDWMLY